MVEAFQIHAVLQILSLLFLVGAVFLARKHKTKRHHVSIAGSLVLSTIAVILMMYLMGGLPLIHCRFGFSVYLLMLVTALTGSLFLRRRLSRNQHRALALLTIALLLFMILYGFMTFGF
ncbi:MAG: hypothetical protein JSV58_06050 [Candidatus Bathyarchaeota archaeon]|nr:MAG: hypothetical protein JSV58_06050 [Candidatus Bathyarchaeota archaeon]